MIENQKTKNIFLFIVAILVGVLLGLSLIYLTKQKKNYYAVYLNNGSAYFGKLSSFPKLKLSDAVFIQVDSQGDVSLQRFKDVLWGPKGSIYLNRSSILFIAPIDENSPLINFIEGRQQPVQPAQSPQQPPQQTLTVTTTPKQ
jgi:hypothetical protein